MELQPWDLVSGAIARYRTPLGLVHGYLDLSVADAYVRLDGLRTDEKGPHGLTVGGVVRDGMRERMSCEVFKKAPLKVVKKSGNGVWLTDGRMISIRIRKRPTDSRTGRPLKANLGQSLLPGMGLNVFGEVTLVIFWSSSLQSGTLERVVLAAVTNVEDRKRLTIVAEAELPLATELSSGLSTPASPPVEEDDDYQEFWEGIAEEGHGDDDLR